VTAHKILVTAGSTQIPIDRVRAISNIFKGRTGNNIAEFFAGQGYEVTLLTSSPERVNPHPGLQVIPFKTYDDLERELQKQLSEHTFDAVIHSAAVSDYSVSEIYIQEADGTLTPIDRSAKVSSNHEKVFLELRQTRKLIDLMRTSWGFRGFLVKFKLQVGITDDELIAIAQKSRATSAADLCVANCLEWSNQRAYIVAERLTKQVNRDQIAPAIEREFHAYLTRSDR